MSLAKKPQISRFEINKKVRSILIKNGVCMTDIQYTCTTATVHINGTLIKDTGKEFERAAVEYLLKEITDIKSIKHMVVNLSNWDIKIEGGSCLVNKKEDPNLKKDKEKAARNEIRKKEKGTGDGNKKTPDSAAGGTGGTPGGVY
ncbi:MAG: hypothetical protein HQK51_03200 [Oligoflexia bacterium]|nr:hypothetical protein [Oligoflexia bacterium]